MGVVSALADVWSIFECLTAHQRRVVMEMYFNGYTQEECAETLGVNQSTVCRALAAAQRTFEKKEAFRCIKKRESTVVHMKAENEGIAQGTGQRPTKSKAPASSGPPASACPQPDIYYETPDRDAFVKELSFCAASPFLQLQNRGNYNERARLNRERIARDCEERSAEQRALQAA